MTKVHAERATSWNVHQTVSSSRTTSWRVRRYWKPIALGAALWAIKTIIQAIIGAGAAEVLQ